MNHSNLARRRRATGQPLHPEPQQQRQRQQQDWPPTGGMDLVDLTGSGSDPNELLSDNEEARQGNRPINDVPQNPTPSNEILPPQMPTRRPRSGSKPLHHQSMSSATWNDTDFNRSSRNCGGKNPSQSVDDNDDHNDYGSKDRQPSRASWRIRTSNDTVISDGHDSSQSGRKQTLWTERFAPKQSADLCIAPKKVQQAKTWLERVIQPQQQQQQEPSPKLLILVGSPGIGKSTMIRVLAAEMQLQISEWTESSYDYQSYSYRSEQVKQIPPLQSFLDFLQQSTTGLSPLLMAQPDSSIAENTVPANAGKRRKVNSKLAASSSSLFSVTIPGKTLILLDEIPHCASLHAESRLRNGWTQFVQTTAAPAVWIYSHTAEGKYQPDDLERCVEARVLYDPTAVQILSIQAPTQVRLKKLLRSVLAKTTTSDSTMRLQNPTRNKAPVLRMDLDRIVEDVAERCTGDVRNALLTMQFLCIGDSTMTTARRIHTPIHIRSTSSSHGAPDRKLLSFHALGKLLYAKRIKNHPINNNKHNKEDNVRTSSRWDDDRPPLEFDPEQVVDQSEMELSGVLHFVQYHCISFFTDITDVSMALDCYSDAAMWLDQSWQVGSASSVRSSPLNDSSSTTTSTSVFPIAYVTSLAGRATACANRHSISHHQFRQFHAPAIFDVRRKRNNNVDQIRRLQRRLAMQAVIGDMTMDCDDDTSINNNNNNDGRLCDKKRTRRVAPQMYLSHHIALLGGNQHFPAFVQDWLSYMRLIQPDVVTVHPLESHVSMSLPGIIIQQQSSNNVLVTNDQDEHTKAIATAQWMEQEQILLHDDIVDYDSDNN